MASPLPSLWDRSPLLLPALTALRSGAKVNYENSHAKKSFVVAVVQVYRSTLCSLKALAELFLFRTTLFVRNVLTKERGVGIKLHRQRPKPDPASFLTSSPVSISAAKERGAPAEWLLRSMAGGNRRRRRRRRGRRKPCCTCFPRQWAEQSSIGFSPSSPAPQPTDVWVGVRPGRESDTFSANPSFPFPMEPRFG